MDKEILETQKEIAMLLAILVKRGGVQATLIEEMSNVGFGPSRIAELLNTTANTVKVARSVSKKKKKVINKIKK